MSSPVAFSWRDMRRLPAGVTYECADCGHHFASKGWHAEACGSPNFHRVTEPRPPAAVTAEDLSANKGTEQSVGH